MFYKRILLFFFLTALSIKAFSAVFVVTSNADSGPGTLREALTLAAANGSATTDYINFNLPDTSQVGRTITILTGLPNLSSNLVIDGTTQAGGKIGYSNAKIILKTYRSTVSLIVFMGDGLTQVEFYGIFFLDTDDPCNSDPDGAEKTGIKITNSTNIIIGDPGKGNIANGYKYEAFHLENIDQLYLGDNIFGQDASSMQAICSGGINLIGVSNVTIGDKNARNTFLSGLGINVSSTSSNNTINIINNNFGVASDGVSTIWYIDGTFLNISSDLPTPTDPQPSILLNISDNLFSHYGQSFGGLVISRIGGLFTIKHNWFGTDRLDKLPLNMQKAHGGDGICIYLEDIQADVIIGDIDPSLGNKFAYSEVGIIASNCKNVKVIRNSFKCISVQEYENTSVIPQISVTQNTGQYIAGTSSPSALVDVFLSDDCTNCSPETYIGSTNADISGNWKYTFTQAYTRSILANAHVGKQSSNFTKPQINVLKVLVTPFNCGMGGSITGITITNTDKVKWVDVNGVVVSTQLQLTNVKPGMYKLIIGEYCPVESNFIEIQDFTPQIYSDSKQIANPSCNQDNGSINNIFAFSLDGNPVKYVWTDQQAVVVSYTSNVSNLKQGSYTLTVTSSSGCTQTYGPIILQNTTGPNIDQSKVIIQSTNCGQSTGSITNLVVTGTGTLKYIWWNDQQQTVSTTQDLTGQPAGTYKLEVTDDSQCGPVYTTDIAIPQTNGITLDESKAFTTIASCSKDNGSITGIVVNGATNYQWTDANNKVVGSNADLQNAAPGDYVLTATNNFGCSETSKTYHVGQQPPTQFPAYAAAVVPTCTGKSNGAITVVTDNLVNSTRWVDNQGQTIGGKSPAITDLPAGIYQLFLTDANGCENLYNSYTIPTIPQLQILPGAEQITNDQCALKTGSINGVQITGGMLPYTYSWVDANSNVISSSPNLSGAGAGLYTLNVNDASNCGLVSAVYTVQNQNNTIPAPLVANVQLCSPGDGLLQVTNPSAVYSYRLYDSETSTTPVDEQVSGSFKITVKANGFYYVTQVSGDCESSKTKVQVSVGITSLDIANAFTPNGDGINDYWKIKGVENYPAAIVQVFTRNGQKIFESRGYATPFDGTYKGKQLPVGVYYYIINLGTNCNLLSGSLTIIR